MRRTTALLLTVGLALGCSDGDLPSAPEASGAISDGTGTEGDVGDDADLTTVNRHFFWLPPMVSKPDESDLGAFDPAASPTVRIVCWEDSDPNATCDPNAALATFTVGNGLVVETDHYKAEFDTRAAELRSSAGDDDFTTYRIEALTPPLLQFGGPFAFGVADFRLGENGKEARNVDNAETIGLVDGRTLPIRFRLDVGALEQELVDNTAPADDPTGEEAFCLINCSLTVIDPNVDTEASLFDPETGEELTAMLIPAGAVWTNETAVLVIDERVDDGDAESGELCLTSGEIPTEACFRYELSPDNPDGDDFFPDEPDRFVRYGVCPEGQAVANGAIRSSWRLLKADRVLTGVNGTEEVVITRPPEVDVSDFLQCDVQTTTTMRLWKGPGGELAGSALTWLVPPVEASDFIGGQLRNLSDLLWGEDVEASRLTFPTSSPAGTTLSMTVELLAVHPDPDEPASGREVTFTRTAGTGALADPDGIVTPSNGSITLPTDGNGRATVNWTIASGPNRLEVTSPDARPAADEPVPLAFDVTGTAVVSLLGPEDGELIQQNDASLEQCTLLTQQPWRGHGYQVFFDWTDASGQVDAYQLEARIEDAALALVDVTLDDPPTSEFTFTSCNSIAPGGDADAATWTVEVVSGEDVSAPVTGSFGWTECVLADGTSCRTETSDTRIVAGTGLSDVTVTLESCGAGSTAGTPGTCSQAGAVFSATGTTDGDGQVVFDNAPEGLATGFWRVTPQQTADVACNTAAETVEVEQNQTATVNFVCFLTVS